MQKPEKIELIGDFVAIRWDDGREDIVAMSRLRELSPSAENMGERDLFGRQIGGSGPQDHSGVRVVSWSPVGSYAVGFVFSDGHRTGIYPFPYLRKIAAGDAGEKSGQSEEGR